MKTKFNLQLTDGHSTREFKDKRQLFTVAIFQKTIIYHESISSTTNIQCFEQYNNTYRQIKYQINYM